MRVQSKTTTALAEEIDVTRGHLSGVLSRKNPLSDAKIQHGTFCFFDPPGGGVSWEVLKQREEGYFVGLIHLSLVAIRCCKLFV